MSYATWLLDVLTTAGIKVVAYPGWAARSSLGKKNPGPAGPLATDRPALLWHHDASPTGDSPGALGHMLRMLTVPGAASANIWVDRAGVWHLLAAGTTWHAGTVSDARWSNDNSIGIETDHTTGEDWPPALLGSLRRGTAAILRHVGRTPADALNFHKHVALPKGSKVDPDGLDLPTERAAVAALMKGTEDMSLTPAQENQLTSIYTAVFGTGGDVGDRSILTRLIDLERKIDVAARPAVDIPALAAELIKQLGGRQ